MGAPVGNQFWKLRSKHGRDALFATADLLWDAACEYFEWCVDNPLISIEYYGKDAERVEVPKVKAFTIIGLCLYLDCNVSYFRQFKDTDLGKTKDFSTIVTRIEEVIYNQKFEHAAAGFLNANIIARELGLSEKNDTSISHTVDMNDLKQLAAAINDA